MYMRHIFVCYTQCTFVKLLVTFIVDIHTDARKK